MKKLVFLMILSTPAMAQPFEKAVPKKIPHAKPLQKIGIHRDGLAFNRIGFNKEGWAVIAPPRSDVKTPKLFVQE